MSGTELTLPQRAAAALQSDVARAEIAKIVEQTVTITEALNKAGRDQTHSGGMRLKNLRGTIKSRAKDARDDATKFSKAVIEEEKALIALIEPEETRLFALRDDWDEARAAEKRAAEEKAAARRQAVQEAIDAIKGYVTRAAFKTAKEIDQLSIELDFEVIDEARFDKRVDEAKDLRTITMRKLTELHDAAIASEEAARAAAERAEALRIEQARIAEEQAQQRAALALREQALAEEERRAQAARDEADRVARAERDRADREAREQLAARQREIDVQEAALREQRRAAQEAADLKAAAARKAEQARLDAEAAERRAAAEAEVTRIATERAAEQARLDAEAAERRAEVERKHAADLKVRDAAPALLKALREMVHKATKQGWHDAYPEVLQQAFDAIKAATL